MKKKDKVFTWADLKKIVNKMPAKLLKGEVRWWGEEKGGTVQYVHILEEDYHDDGDVGTMPKSIMLENLEPGEDEYDLVFEKGTHILNVD